MTETHQVDAARLYEDLQRHYGTANETIPWIHSTHWLSAALAELETAAQNGDWDHVIEMAMDEGFDLTKYYVDDPVEDEFEPGRTYWDQMAANP